MFLSSVTLRVDSAGAFRAFVQSNTSLVHSIRRLMVHVSGDKSQNWPMYWQDVFNTAFVGCLKSLEGVKFTGKVYWGCVVPRHRRDTNVMDGSDWKIGKLPAYIRSFQQHKLKAELTSVEFEPIHYANEGPWDAKPINEAIRTHLLQHHPRRLSTRGS